MHIKVCQHHIEEGVKKNPFQCAIALALQEKFPDAEAVSVGTRIIIDDKQWDTPRKALHFMSLYDRGDPVGPFEFDVEENSDT